MSVKVTCPDCERVINAPDRARGKAVKCPQCGKVVRVPAAAAVAKKVAAPPPSSSAMIATLDLDRIEDSESRICPKCGAEVGPEDVECPECHVDLETGLLSARNKAEFSRKGPNPKLYYKEFISNGLEFMKKNKRLPIRLTTFSVMFVAIFIGCAFLSLWNVKPLARYFWMSCSVLALLVPPGLAWHLHAVIIDATMRKKKKLGKYNFDKFLGAALGLRLICWFLMVTAPLQLVAIGFAIFASLRAAGNVSASSVLWLAIIAGAVELLAILFASLLFPIASTHMAMPVTIRGWLPHKMLNPLARTFPAVLFWCTFFWLLLLPSLACIGVAGAVSAKNVVALYQDANFNTKLHQIQAEIQELSKNARSTPEQMEFQNKKPLDLNFAVLILPSALLLTAAAWFGATAVFSMRTNGLLGHYFMDRLDLEAMAPEVQYVAKEVNYDDLEERSNVKWPHVIIGLVAAFAVSITLGGTYGSSYMQNFKQGATGGMAIAGGAAALIGLIWMIVVLMKKESRDKSAHTKFAIAVLASGVVYCGIGVGLYLLVKPGSSLDTREIEAAKAAEAKAEAAKAGGGK
jgi:DNA-directed RNA polymerase subunit M/transcription elongation factor TFIIS